MQDERRTTAPDAGFSLIELMVALGILAALVAMVGVGYSGIQTSVRQAATLADLRSDRTALVAYGIDNNGLAPSSSGFDPRGGGTNLVGYGWQQASETTSYRYYTSGDRTSWCLEMTNVTGQVFRISGNTPSAQATCSVLGVANY